MKNKNTLADSIIAKHQPEKQCSGCHRYFPATPDYFHRRGKSPDGLQHHCKACHKHWSLAYRSGRRALVNSKVSPSKAAMEQPTPQWHDCVLRLPTWSPRYHRSAAHRWRRPAMRVKKPSHNNRFLDFSHIGRSL